MADVHSLAIDVRQALANLIFAASRYGELPVLHSLRCFFGERYGREFEIANVELHRENMVSSQIKLNLCRNLVADDEKLKLISEIAKEHSHFLGFWDCQQSSNMQCHKINSLSHTEFKPAQRAEVLDLDIFEMYPDNDSGNSNGTPGSSNRVKIDVHVPKVEYKEALSARTSSDGMTATPRMSIVYLDDDLDEKSVNQEHCSMPQIDIARTSLDSWGGNAGSVTDPRTGLANKCSSDKTASPNLQSWPCSERDNVGKNGGKIVKGRHPFRSPNDELRKSRQCCVSHVHPNLPNNEDVVAILTDIDAGYNMGDNNQINSDIILI
ncbi:uncharacterized protein LOC121236692 [Juglans microcarpa x Juglans regia]|uniref:uncharacterized protein LOC121236692 n=1 Tax=Juglans microcarpa x Juglans regia TaxID=2249226 RepID=UPI001B7E6E50|nr:uncharacterized protein LOC121236692 [Juglans microcarpa x Juglans regia]